MSNETYFVVSGADVFILWGFPMESKQENVGFFFFFKFGIKILHLEYIEC